MTESEDLTAELLAQPLEKFTAYRNAKAKQLKASGQADLASQLSALKKPSVSLWASNQGARSNPAVLRDLRQSALALAKTQAAAGARRANAAQELRSASEDFQQKLDAASNAAAAALRLRQEATAAASAAQRAADRAIAAEEEAARAKAQAAKSRRAIANRRD